jgi:hypothetical protein
MTEYHNCIVRGPVINLRLFLEELEGKLFDLKNLEEDYENNDITSVIDLQFSCRDFPKSLLIKYSELELEFSGVFKMEGFDGGFTLYQVKLGKYQEFNF